MGFGDMRDLGLGIRDLESLLSGITFKSVIEARTSTTFMDFPLIEALPYFRESPNGDETLRVQRGV